MPSKGDNKNHPNEKHHFGSYRLSPVTTGVTSSSWWPHAQLLFSRFKKIIFLSIGNNTYIICYVKGGYSSWQNQTAVKTIST